MDKSRLFLLFLAPAFFARAEDDATPVSPIDRSPAKVIETLTEKRLSGFAAIKHGGFAEKLRRYRTLQSSLTPGEQAAEWVQMLKLVEERNAAKNSMRELILALPGPEAWPEIARLIEKLPRATKKTRFLGFTLAGDEEGQWIVATEPETSGDPFPKEQVYRALLLQTEDPSNYLRATQWLLDNASKLPDFASVLNPEESERLVLAALGSDRAWYEGARTREFAIRIALRKIESTPKPRWNWINSFSKESFLLTEGWITKFPEQWPPSDSEASRSYFLGLLAANRIDDILRILRDRPEQIRSVLELRGWRSYAEQYWKCLMALRETQPNSSPLLGRLLDVGKVIGKHKEAMSQLEKSCSQERPGTSLWQRLKFMHAEALLADDEIDRAAPILIAIAATPVEGGDFPRLRSATLLLQVGDAIGNETLLQEGVRLLRTLPPPNNLDQRFLSAVATPAYFADAWSMLLSAAGAELQRAPDYLTGIRQDLVNICGLYYDQGRYSELIEFVDQCPYWGAASLGEIFGESDFRSRTLGFLVGDSLARIGRRERAAEVLRALASRHRDSDAAFALLADLEGTRLIPFLNAQIQAHPLDELPLLWKAEVLRRTGDLAEAEQCTRKAMEIDAESSNARGQRVLAAILDATGRTAEAEPLRPAIAVADERKKTTKYSLAGLYSRTRNAYRDALEKDPFATGLSYANMLLAQGRDEEALPLVRKGYARLPRLLTSDESYHVEGNLAGYPTMQTAAEEGLQDCLREDPQNSQALALLGSLKLLQKKEEEARSFLFQAVELDPNCIGAWRQLCRMAEFLKPEERNQAILNYFRCDPWKLSDVYALMLADCAGLWREAEKARQRIEPAAVGLNYPLRGKKSEGGEDPNIENRPLPPTGAWLILNRTILKELF